MSIVCTKYLRNVSPYPHGTDDQIHVNAHDAEHGSLVVQLTIESGGLSSGIQITPDAAAELARALSEAVEALRGEVAA